MPIALIAWPGLLFWAALWEGWGGRFADLFADVAAPPRPLAPP